MRLARLAASALVAGALAAPSAARAADYYDRVDEFSAHVDPPGFIGCTTFPVDQWDKVDCDGLNPQFEATMRAAIPSDVTLVGASVHRAESWGFRVQATRFDVPFIPVNDVNDDARALAAARAHVTDALHAANVPLTSDGVDVRDAPLGELHAVRVAYETTSNPPMAIVKFIVPTAHGMIDLELAGARDHAKELATIAERAAWTIRVKPAPKRAALFGLGMAALVGLLAFGGTIALVVILAGTRRTRRTSAVSWPGTRGD